jgi:uncharacterized protein YjbI with pentapeptide repeats
MLILPSEWPAAIIVLVGGFLGILFWRRRQATQRVRAIQTALRWQANGCKDSLCYTDLRGADLSGVRLGRETEGEPCADLIGTNLKGAKLERADLRGARLVSVNLQRANLEGADLRGACLEYANLKGASLKNTDLRQAKLGEVDLSAVDLSTALLSGAEYSYRTKWPAGFKPHQRGAKLDALTRWKADYRRRMRQGRM